MTTAYNCGRGKGGRGPGLTAELLQHTLICGLRSSGTNATVKHLHQNLTQYCHHFIQPLFLSKPLPSYFHFLLLFLFPIFSFFTQSKVVAFFILLKPFISSASNLALCPIRGHPRPTAVIDLMLESHYNCMTDYPVTLSSEQPFLITFFHPLLLLPLLST